VRPLVHPAVPAARPWMTLSVRFMKHTTRPLFPASAACVACLLTLPLAGCATPDPSANALAHWPTPVAAATPPAATPEAAPPDLGDSPTLNRLLELALDRNPRIQSARESVLAAVEVGAIEGALPDPQVLLGWYATPVETRVGPQEWSLGIRQSIPFPSKLGDRSKLGRTLAGRESIAYERVVRDVLVEVVQTVDEIAYLDRAEGITGEIAPLLDRYAAAAADSDGALSELFRAETQRAQLENDRVLLTELRAVEAERLRSLLDLPPRTPIGRIPPRAVPRLETSFDELLEIARQHNQELKEAGVLVEAAGVRTDLARKSWLPDLSVGYTQILTGNLSTPLGSPADSGQDAQIFQFGFSLPLWANRNGAEVRRARAMERAAIEDERAVRLRLRPQLARAWFQVGNARRLVDLYEGVLIGRAEQAARTAEDLQKAGKGSLAGTIETLAVLHNFRLAAARARADLGQAIAALEAILGRPLEGGAR